LKQITQHEEKEKVLQEIIERLEQRLGTLDSEYSQQIASLRASYQHSLEQAARGVEGAGIGLDEGVRQRYKAEIQQLRALCEKGLVAMENSHRRIVAELREEHEQQIQQMKREKEEALAEETQATLAG
jgi:myosin phosphatase Rho-interacting protein